MNADFFQRIVDHISFRACFWSSLPHIRSVRDSQAENKVPLIENTAEGSRLCDLTESTQTPYRPIGIKRRVRHVRARVGEMRRIADVGSRGAELDLPFFRHRESAEQTHIQVVVARA